MSYSAPWNAPKRRVIDLDQATLTTPPVVTHAPMSDATPAAPKKESKPAATPKPKPVVEEVVEEVVEPVEEPETEE